MDKIWSLYLIRCSDGSIYCGISDDVQARLRAHQAGRGAKYTRGRGPLELVYREVCGSHSEALKREYQVKKLSRKQKLALIAQGPEKEGTATMTYDQVRQNAKGHMGPCSVCQTCNGLACGNHIPGPGGKGSGKVFSRNCQGWQDILINMDTIADNCEPDTSSILFGQSVSLPVFAAPIGAVQNHYGDLLTEEEYTQSLVRGCVEAGTIAFTGDGVKPFVFDAGCQALHDYGMAVPTVKPWNRQLVFEKIDQAKQAGARMLCMDIDAAGLPFLKNTTPPSGSKSVEELREIIDYAGIPFILKGIMTSQGAQKALQAGAAGIVVSNHGGRVLDDTPATAWVLEKIAKVVDGRMTVLVDGGIRTGADVFKALALGADGVLIGRPFVTAVYGGRAEGVQAYVQLLTAQLKDTMQMCGCHSLAQIGENCIWKP